MTDANVVLGRINPAYLLGGKMKLDRRLAEQAVATVGPSLGLNVIEAARGIVDVVNSTMVRAIRVVSVDRGLDPRDFSLVAFGGAGPLHACELARELGMQHIIVPPYPGLLCALGLLVSELRVDRSLTRRFVLHQVDTDEVRSAFAQVEHDSRSSPAVQSHPEADWVPSYSADMRYLGQSYELRVPIVLGHLLDSGLQALGASFDEVHEQVYGFANQRSPKEIVCFRVSLRAIAGLTDAQLPQHVTHVSVISASREVYFRDAGWVRRCPVHQRSHLGPGAQVRGPAVIEQMDTTLLVTPEFTAEVDAHTNLILRPH